MLPVICPKCRAKNWVGPDEYGRFSTLIKCGHFSANVQEYYRQEEMKAWALRKLKETNEAIRNEERRILYGEGLPMPEGLLSFGADISLPPWAPFNCRCTIEPVGEGNGPVTGLGYAIVPHQTTSGVKGFYYGFK